ncbi:hypothetical protein HYW61_01795 [candidate division WWE3 bacterium]|nr:hypothetical protein [candidate division WWE3 bacterium]
MTISDITNFLGMTYTQKTPEPSATERNEPIEPKRILLAWEAKTKSPSTPNKKSLRAFVIIGAVVILLFALMQEFLLILALVSLAFVGYILSATPGEVVSHEISNYGVSFAGQLYRWSQLKYFFFSEKPDSLTLCIDTVEILPGRLFLAIDASSKEKVKDIVGVYLAFLEEEPKTLIDKAYDVISDKLSLND